jgi:uncharacterized protein (TIGR03435 family)
MARNMNVLLSGKLSFVTARLICVVALISVAVSGAFAQGNAAASAADAKAAEVILPGAVYDVATIKPHNPSLNISFGSLPNGGFISTGMSLKNLVCGAYNKKDFQCLGGPAWLDSDRYDVEAKPDSALSDQLLKLSPEQRWKVQGLMKQALLEDRIKLKVHHETRVLPIFALVVAKGGLKMQEGKAGDNYSKGLKWADGKGMGAGSFTIGNGMMQAQGISMDSLADQLTNEVGHIVQNKTGLTGVDDFTLRYSDDLATGADSSVPSIFTALQEQLGLKLENAKAPVDVIVIDHVERPSAN